MLCISCKAEIPNGSLYCNRCGKKQAGEKKKRTKRPNGTGSIIKLPGKRKKPYQAVITLRREFVDGVSVQKRLSLGTFSTITEATKALGEHVSESTTDLYNYTVEDVYNVVKNEYFPSLSPSGISSHNSAWPRFSPIKRQKMRDIKTQHLQQIIDNAMTVKRSKDSISRPLSREGKAKIKNLASILCRWAIKNDIIDKNYAEFIVLPPSDSSKKRNFTDTELARLSLAAEEDDAAKITLILNYTGARINGIASYP